jgi:hypothetical protein
MYLEAGAYLDLLLEGRGIQIFSQILKFRLNIYKKNF